MVRRLEVEALRDELGVPGDLHVHQVERDHELRELGLDAAPVGLEQAQPFGGRVLALLDQLRVAMEVLERHPRGAEALDELDPAHVVVGEPAVAALGPADAREDPDALVVAERVGGQAGLRGGPLDGARHPSCREPTTWSPLQVKGRTGFREGSSAEKGA